MMEIEFTEETRVSLNLTFEQFEEFKHLWANSQEWPDLLRLYFWYETRLGSLDGMITALAEWVKSDKKLNLFQAAIRQNEEIVDGVHRDFSARREEQIKRLAKEKDYYRLAISQMVRAATAAAATSATESDFWSLQELVMNMGNKALVSWEQPQQEV